MFVMLAPLSLVKTHKSIFVQPQALQLIEQNPRRPVYLLDSSPISAVQRLAINECLGTYRGRWTYMWAK